MRDHRAESKLIGQKSNHHVHIQIIWKWNSSALKIFRYHLFRFLIDLSRNICFSLRTLIESCINIFLDCLNFLQIPCSQPIRLIRYRKIWWQGVLKCYQNIGLGYIFSFNTKRYWVWRVVKRINDLYLEAINLNSSENLNMNI